MRTNKRGFVATMFIGMALAWLFFIFAITFVVNAIVVYIIDLLAK